MATAAASGNGNENKYVYYRTVKRLKTLLAEIKVHNNRNPYTLQLTSDVSTYEILPDNYLFAVNVINGGEIIRTDVYNNARFKLFTNFVSAPAIAVGKYNKTYPYYRKVTAADWKNPTFQAQLVAAHQKGGGWSLLEEPLICNNYLHVAEGLVEIDRAGVVEVGFNGFQQLSNVYPAMNIDTEVAWTTTAPAPSNKWTVEKYDSRDYPCLFVKDGNFPNAATAADAIGAAPIVAPAAADEDLAAAAPIAAVVKPDFDVNFAIGYHGMTYDNFTAMSFNDVIINKQKIIEEYRKNNNNSFFLLVQPFEYIANTLCANDACILIEDALIICDKNNTRECKIPKWNTITFPTSKNKWTKQVPDVPINLLDDFFFKKPCLFMRIPKK